MNRSGRNSKPSARAERWKSRAVTENSRFPFSWFNPFLSLRSRVVGEKFLNPQQIETNDRSDAKPEDWKGAIVRPSNSSLRALPGRPTAASPDKAESDIRHVIAVSPVVLGLFEVIEKPFIPIPEIKKRLIGYKELQPGIWSECSCSVSVVPNRSSRYTEVGHDDVRKPKIVV